MLHTAQGILKYNQNSYKLIVEVEQDIVDYYRALLPKYIVINRQRYGAHISVVRKEMPTCLDVWGKYEGELVTFNYTSEVFFSKVYCWLNVFCVRLEEIRLELGLPVASEYTLPPEGFIKCFHMTLGNFKSVP